MLNEISIDLDQYWYKYYAMIDYWTPEEAVTLACNLNPQCKIETVKILKAAGEDVPLMDLLIRAIECDKIIVIDNRIRPLDFIKWCKSKDIPFPRKLEALVRKFHVSEAEDLAKKCPKCYDELERLRKKISDLEKSLSTPHHKRAVSLHKGFIGALSSKYGRDKILTSFDENLVLNSDDKKSKIEIARIIRDFDSQGINLDDQTIKGLIKESIDYLK